MLEQDHNEDSGAAEELLRRALLDDSSAGGGLVAGRRPAAERGGDGDLPRAPRPRDAPDLHAPAEPWRRRDGGSPAS